MEESPKPGQWVYIRHAAEPMWLLRAQVVSVEDSAAARIALGGAVLYVTDGLGLPGDGVPYAEADGFTWKLVVGQEENPTGEWLKEALEEQGIEVSTAELIGRGTSKKGRPADEVSRRLQESALRRQAEEQD